MLTAVLLLAGTAAQAQERGANQNDLTFAVTAGYNASVMQEAQPGNWGSYSIAAPSTNWNDGNGRHPRLRRRGQPQHHAVQRLPGLRPLLPHRSRRTPSLRGNQGWIRLRSGHRLQGRRDMVSEWTTTSRRPSSSGPRWTPSPTPTATRWSSRRPASVPWLPTATTTAPSPLPPSKLVSVSDKATTV